MSEPRNSIAETADSASAAAAASASSAPPSASTPQPTETSNANQSQNQCQPGRQRHHHRRHNSGDMMLTAAAAVAQQTGGENALGIMTAPYGFTNSSAGATMRADEDSRRSSTATTTMAAHYDSFADEYWFRVHNQAMRVQREHQRPPPRETAEERVREARRAYTGLTNMLQRLRSNSPEEK
ncbi:hypothetical protein NLG97_g9145 [Lecanicillium saksenae]|uniref:Uncharacterized protein n=1 Tax=Lecanicillium saksenae TaxID=468837 RepID=A0ACC1QI49_9HYPO|nr:hypothetical protein NLG97_g9145 [Lecanicillium saksenae]